MKKPCVARCTKRCEDAAATTACFVACSPVSMAGSAALGKVGLNCNERSLTSHAPPASGPKTGNDNKLPARGFAPGRSLGRIRCRQPGRATVARHPGGAGLGATREAYEARGRPRRRTRGRGTFPASSRAGPPRAGH